MRDLDEQVGGKQFAREGRNLVLTDTGRLVFSDVDGMFKLGLELQDLLTGNASGSIVTAKVGVAVIVPKLLARRVLAPALERPERVRLIYHGAPLADLLANFAVHKLDVVLADSPINPALNIRACTDAIGESGIRFFDTPEEAEIVTAELPSTQ